MPEKLANYRFNHTNHCIEFFTDEASILIDSELFTRIMLEQVNDEALIEHLISRGYRVQEKQFGMLIDRWLTK